MFTPLKAKELLLPLAFDTAKVFYCFQTKTSENIDWAYELVPLIRKMQLDPACFQGPIRALTAMRTAFLAGSDISQGLAYFYEVEQLGNRFALKASRTLSFSWSNSLEKECFASQQSFAFEKANVLYNVASYTCKGVALKPDDSEAFRSGFKRLCTGAAIWDWIGRTYTDAPLTDVRSSVSCILRDVCLFEAQILSFFLSVSEGKPLKTLARISIGIMTLAEKALDSINQEGLPELHSIYDSVTQNLGIQNLVHIAIMSEFWDASGRPDISVQLLKSFMQYLDAAPIESKDELRDYYQVAILSTQKQLDNWIMNEKNDEKLEAFVLAVPSDFKALIRENVTEAKDLFAAIFPPEVIECNAVFLSRIESWVSDFAREEERLLSRYQGMTSLTEDMPRAIATHLYDATIGDELPLRLQKFNQRMEYLRKQIQCAEHHFIDELDVASPALLAEVDGLVSNSWYKRLSTFSSFNIFMRMLSPLLASHVGKFKESMSQKLDDVRSALDCCRDRGAQLRQGLAADIKDDLLCGRDRNEVLRSKILDFEGGFQDAQGSCQAVEKALNEWETIWVAGLESCKASLLHVVPDLHGLNSKLEACFDQLSNLETCFDAALTERKQSAQFSATRFHALISALINKY